MNCYRTRIVEVGWDTGMDTKEDKLLLRVLCSYFVVGKA